MTHCSIVGCKNNNSEVAYFSLRKDPQRQKSWLATISRDKSNLPSNVFGCLDHFEEKYFDKLWDLQNRLLYTLPHQQISTPGKTSEIRAKQKEKGEAKL